MLLGLLVAAVVAKEWTFNKFSLADGQTRILKLGNGTMDVDYVHLSYTYPAFGCNTGASSFKFAFKDMDLNSVYTKTAVVSTGTNFPSFGSIGKATYMSLTNENSVCDVDVSGYIEYSSFTPFPTPAPATPTPNSPLTLIPSTLAPPTPTPGTTWGFSDITIPAGGTHTLSFGTKDVNYMHLTYTYPQGGCSGDTMFNIDFTAPGVNSMYVQQVPPTGKNVPASGGVGYVSDASIKNMNTACDVVVSGYIQYTLHTPQPTPVPTPLPTPAPTVSYMTVVACGAASCRLSHSYPVGVCTPIRDFCNGNQLIAYVYASDYFPGSSAEVVFYKDSECSEYTTTVYLGCSCTSYEGFSGQLVCSTPPSSGGSGGTSPFVYVGIGVGVLVVLGGVSAVVGYVIWQLSRTSMQGAATTVWQNEAPGGADYDAMPMQSIGLAN